MVGAGGSVEGRAAKKVSRFLGDISYPIYMTHYPLIYLYYAMMINKTIPESAAIPGGLVVFFSAIGLSYVYSRFYDVPVREWLKEKYLMDRKAGEPPSTPDGMKNPEDR